MFPIDRKVSLLLSDTLPERKPTRVDPRSLIWPVGEKFYRSTRGELHSISAFLELTVEECPEYIVDPRAHVDTNIRNLEATLAALKGKNVEDVFGKVINLDLVKFTDWRPDTCFCHLQYIWDRSTSEDHRVHYPHQHFIRCEHHQRGNSEFGDYWSAARDNTHKNISIRTLTEAYPDIDGGTVAWTYNANRELTLWHPALSSFDKENMRHKLAEKFILRRPMVD
jgi:hypothetical protein